MRKCDGLKVAGVLLAAVVGGGAATAGPAAAVDYDYYNMTEGSAEFPRVMDERTCWAQTPLTGEWVNACSWDWPYASYSMERMSEEIAEAVQLAEDAHEGGWYADACEGTAWLDPAMAIAHAYEWKGSATAAKIGKVLKGPLWARTLICAPAPNNPEPDDFYRYHGWAD